MACYLVLYALERYLTITGGLPGNQRVVCSSRLDLLSSHGCSLPTMAGQVTLSGLPWPDERAVDELHHGTQDDLACQSRWFKQVH
jgi:hypothetical protein